MADRVNLDFRVVYFDPFVVYYNTIYTHDLIEIEPFVPEIPDPPTPPWAAAPYVDGTDGNLSEPSDAYNTVNNFCPMLSRDDTAGGQYVIRMKLGTFIWEHNDDTAPSKTRSWTGQSQGTTYGACLLSVGSPTPQHWNNFRGIPFNGDAWTPDYVTDNFFGDLSDSNRMQYQNGFKKFYFPKTGNGTKDGGWIGFYYHGHAIKNAVGGTTNSLEISTNHSLYTVGNVGVDAELVVRWDGMVGPAGQGSGVESWKSVLRIQSLIRSNRPLWPKNVFILILMTVAVMTLTVYSE